MEKYFNHTKNKQNKTTTTTNKDWKCVIEKAMTSVVQEKKDGNETNNANGIDYKRSHRSLTNTHAYASASFIGNFYSSVIVAFFFF